MKARSAFRPSTCLDEKSGLTGAAGSTSSARKLQDAVALGRLESELGAESAALGKALDELRATTQAVLSSNDLALGLANATIYLDAFGHVAHWLDVALAGDRGDQGAARESGWRGAIVLHGQARGVSIFLPLRIAED